MCGIAGFVARKSIFDPGQIIREMTDRVQHRGPDDAGHYVRGRVALGHRRLAILDLTPSGHQPMSSQGGRYVITFNGEIYNYLELRKELSASGATFRTGTDTEVILAAFDAWGEECLSRFNGMWAFAIYDVRNERLFAARDRFGVKPFHYVLNDACFAFGSEIRQLLPLMDSVKANPVAVSDFLLTGAHIQSTESFFEGVFNLKSGHYLTYDVRSDSCSVGRYYSLSERLENVEERSGPEALDQLRFLLEDSVRLRLRSDVRVGTCLSGGLDSSSVAMIAARLHGRGGSPFSAITAVSEDPRNSEEAYAREVVEAGALGWIRVRPGYEDFQGLLPHIVKHQEEPFATPSICMQAFVMRAARENGVVVLLDGQGGDETLLGYDRYYSAYCITLWRQGGVREMLQGLQQAVRHNANLNALQLVAYVMLGLLPSARYLYYLMRGSYLAPRPAPPDWVGDFARSCLDVRSLQALEVEVTGLPQLLRFEDKNSMAYAIEARLPFLDYRLVEHALSLAPNLKIRQGWTKWALRQAMSDVLPPDIAWRRNKIGFAAPDDLWIGRHLNAMARTVAASPLVDRFCHLGRLMRRYQGLDRGSQWRLYSLALWEGQFGVRV